MLNDVYFVDLQMTGLHWIYTLVTLFLMYLINQVTTVHFASEIKKYMKSIFEKKKKVGFK